MIIENRAYHSQTKQDESFKPWLKGSDVGRYTLTWSGEYISYGPWLAAPREPKIFKGPRLLIREVVHSSTLYIVYTDKEIYYGHCVIPVLIKESYGPQYILSLCASLTVGFWARYKAANVLKDAFPKVNPDDVRRIPVRRILFNTTQKHLENEVKELKNLYRDAVSPSGPTGPAQT